jgi:antirestriction protein ArdC
MPGRQFVDIPITDRIILPPRELFASGEEYYATALHETVHRPVIRSALHEKGFAKSLRSVRLLRPFKLPHQAVQK